MEARNVLQEPCITKKKEKKIIQKEIEEKSKEKKFNSMVVVA